VARDRETDFVQQAEVRAILSGAKTVTRRIVKPQPSFHVRQRLWVRETWWKCPCDCDQIVYREKFDAGGYPNLPVVPSGWRPSIFMQRSDSRITLEVVSVRVERLHEITEDDAIREGVDAVSVADVPRNGTLTRRDDFAQLWQKINGKRAPWASNPFVWRVEFKVLKACRG